MAEVGGGPSQVTVRFPRPFPHQRAMLDRPHPRKLLRWGRRASKSRCALIGASAGHGPLVKRQVGADPEGRALIAPEPMHRGFIRGGTVAWVGIGYDQTQKIWLEEILPRFDGVPGFTVNQADYQVFAPPYGPHHIRGNLKLYTSRNVGSLLGAKLHGLVLDEFAHWEGDPYDSWRRILRFTLLDYAGWAMFPSTPYPGSYFDELCERFPWGADDLPQPDGEPSRTWTQSHHTTAANPKLSPEDVAEVIAEYPAGDVNLDTEVYAKLVSGGAGLAFPNFVANVEERVHVVRPSPLPRFWRPVASMDWGFATGCIGTFDLGPEGEVVQRHELGIEKRHGHEAGEFYIDTLLELGMRLPELVTYDEQMDFDPGQKAGSSIAQEFLEGMLSALRGQAEFLPAMIPAKKGPGSRVPGWNMVRKALAWEDSRDERGLLQPWAAPRLRIFSSCPRTIYQLSKAQNSEKVQGDVDKDKTPTHQLDVIRYLLVVKAAGGEPPPRDVPPDVSPGLKADGSLRRRRQPDPWELQHRGTLYDELDADLPGFYNPFGADVAYDDEEL